MFGTTRFTSLPEELTATHEAWENYLGNVWRDLLIGCGLKSEDTIIEVAPGYSSKIGLGLMKAGFEGIIYLVEPLGTILQTQTDRYQKLLPDANIRPCNLTLQEAVNLLPKEPDFILSNHPLDDMLMLFAAQAVSTDLFICTSERYNVALNKLKNQSEQSISSVSQCWINAIEKLQPKTTMISQYPSLTLKNHQHHLLNTYAKEVLQRLKEYFSKENSDCVQDVLNAHENFNDDYIGNGVLNAAYWMVLDNA